MINYREYAETVFGCAIELLTDEQKANLMFHMRAGTPVCHGETANLFTDGKGGG